MRMTKPRLMSVVVILLFFATFACTRASSPSAHGRPLLERRERCAKNGREYFRAWRSKTDRPPDALLLHPEYAYLSSRDTCLCAAVEIATGPKGDAWWSWIVRDVFANRSVLEFRVLYPKLGDRAETWDFEVDGKALRLPEVAGATWETRHQLAFARDQREFTSRWKEIMGAEPPDRLQALASEWH